jgi:2-polyprenyl-3-methyl-5-hydroxy-6-metoxy-1,4-benzoquinol methylase
VQPTQQSESFRYTRAAPSPSHEILLPSVLDVIGPHKGARLFDLGCGNGSMAAKLVSLGYDVTGVDPSHDGIRFAANSGAKLELGSDAEDLRGRFGTFPFVICLEVVEHVYSPWRLTSSILSLLEPGGTAVISARLRRRRSG